MHRNLECSHLYCTCLHACRACHTVGYVLMNACTHASRWNLDFPYCHLIECIWTQTTSRYTNKISHSLQNSPISTLWKATRDKFWHNDSVVSKSASYVVIHIHKHKLWCFVLFFFVYTNLCENSMHDYWLNSLLTSRCDSECRLWTQKTKSANYQRGENYLKFLINCMFSLEGWPKTVQSCQW